MATLKQISSAVDNTELRARLELAAASLGVAGTDVASRQAVWDRIVAIVSTPLDDTAAGQTIADVLAYAQNTHDAAVAALPPSPGSDPSAVTDNMLREAVSVLLPPAPAPESPPVSS